MTRYDVLTIGGTVKDYTFYTDQGKIFLTPDNLTAQKMVAFEYGAKINLKDVYLNWGGGAANSAVALGRLGFKVGISTRLGKDESGLAAIENLKKEKVITDLVQIDQKIPTGFTFILGLERKEREHVGFLYRGANNNLKLNEKNFISTQAEWFYLTSLAGTGWLTNLKVIFNQAKKKKIKIAWNPGNSQLEGGKRILASFLSQTELLILNKDEAIELVLSGVKLGQKNPNCLNRPVYLLNILHEWGPKIVVITEGKKGAWAYDGKKIYHQKASSSRVVDTTGVGDAFGSTFLAGLIKNQKAINLALKWAIINSGSVLTKVGAQNGLLSLKDLEKKL